MSATAIDPGVAELRERIRDAAAHNTALRISGSGTWLDGGRVVDASDMLLTRELSGIVAYVPGDLTLTARAGTTLAEIHDAVAAHNQWLALDPHGTDEGTIGATTATGSSGPLSTGVGGPRDLVLGVEFVTGVCAIARGGGRVVKNVAGFDLTRLICGSWGSLGVVTEVTVRLHAQPEADLSFAVQVDDVAKVRTLLRRLPFTPFACEVLNGVLTSELLGGSSTTALFRLGGNSEAVAAQRASLAELGTLKEVDPSTWTRLRAADSSSPIVFRLSNLPSEIAATWNEAVSVADAKVHASPMRGIVRVLAPGLRNTSFTSTRIAERLPAGLWPLFPAQTAELQSRMKSSFDPSNVLNPGILGWLA